MGGKDAEGKKYNANDKYTGQVKWISTQKAM